MQKENCVSQSLGKLVLMNQNLPNSEVIKSKKEKSTSEKILTIFLKIIYLIS
jgi:hypothetical protein